MDTVTAGPPGGPTDEMDEVLLPARSWRPTLPLPLAGALVVVSGLLAGWAATSEASGSSKGIRNNSA